MQTPGLIAGDRMRYSRHGEVEFTRNGKGLYSCQAAVAVPARMLWWAKLAAFASGLKVRELQKEKYPGTRRFSAMIFEFLEK